MAYFGPNIFNATPTSTSGTASSGQHVIVSANSPTITLPVPFKNARVKVTNYGSGIATVSHNASEVVYGLGLGSSGSSTVVVGSYGGAVTVESDGVSWYLTAGYSGQNFVQSFIANDVSLTQNTDVNITSVSLSAGTWQINASVLISGNAADTYGDIWLGTTTASTTGLFAATSWDTIYDGTTTNRAPITMTIVQTFTSTTTVYLEARGASASISVASHVTSNGSLGSGGVTGISAVRLG